MEQIICSDVALGYEGKEIISHLSFTVSEGDYLCIIGENGSGKTTLMKTLLGLRKPMSGTIEMPRTGGGEIGYLPQQTLLQRDFPASVREIVLSGCQGLLGKRAFYSKEHKAMAQAAMERMSITKLADKCYAQLSGGQQQRVLLARALCAAGKILLMDEPVAGLDPAVTEQMYALIEQLHKDGTTIIMITHDLDAVRKYATHVLRIDKQIFFGTRREFLRRQHDDNFTRMGDAYIPRLKPGMGEGRKLTGRIPETEDTFDASYAGGKGSADREDLTAAPENTEEPGTSEEPETMDIYEEAPETGEAQETQIADEEEADL